MCGTTHSYLWHDSFIFVTGFIHICGMTHSYVWHISFICVTWLIHVSHEEGTYEVGHRRYSVIKELVGVFSLVYEDLTLLAHSYVWHVPFMCVTGLIHVCDMTHSYVWHDSFICVTWLIRICSATHSCMWHDWFIFVTWRRYVGVKELVEVFIWILWRPDAPEEFICAVWFIHTHDMTYSCVWHDSFICVIWRRYFGVKELVAVFSRIDEDLTLLTAMLTNVSSALAPVIEVTFLALFVAFSRARTLCLSVTSCVSLTLLLSHSLPHSLSLMKSGDFHLRESNPGFPWTDAWF